MNTIIKNLLSIDKKVLKHLNAVYGFNFEADLFTYEITGNFTINSIHKITDAVNFNEINSKIVIIVEDFAPWNRDHYHIAEVFSNTIDTTRHYRTGIYMPNIDEYTRKSDFEEDRKSKTAHAYLIAQHNIFIKVPEEKQIKRNERFTSCKKGVVNAGYNFKDIEIKKEHDDTILDSYKFRSNYCNHPDYPVIDKSGYITSDKRSHLKQSARKLKAERDAAKFKQFETSEAVNELKEAIKAKQIYICEALKNATTSADFKKVALLMDKYNGYPDLVEDFEIFETRATEKEYKSIESYNLAYEDIKKHLEKLTIE